MRLRKRQEIFVGKSLAALSVHGNTLGVAPTGAGKTVMLSAITGSHSGRTSLILQHRDELVSQNRATFGYVNPTMSSGLFTADRKEWGYDATFAMVQTLSRDKGLASMPPFDLVTIDEAHHVAADSYLRILDQCQKNNPKVHILGVTATPNRGDKKALRGVFSNVADQITIRELIESGHLVRPRTFVIDLGVQGELAEVRKLSTDYDMTQVEKIMDRTVLNDRIVAEWGKIAGSRPTIAFASTVAHAEHVKEAFQAAGVRAGVLSGDMGKLARRMVLEDYDRGRIQVLVNVSVLTEGFDHQPTSCVILLRPSSYKATMIQMVGRGLRKVDPERYPGVHKDDCIVLDFGISLLTHGDLDQDTDLDQQGLKDCPECEASVPAQVKDCPICGFEFPREAAEKKTCGECGCENHMNARICTQCGVPFGEEREPGVISEFVMTEISLIDDSPFKWVPLFDGLVMIACAFDTWAMIINFRGRWHAVGGGKDRAITSLGDFEDRLLSLMSADDFMRLYGDTDSGSKAKRWLNLPATERQMEMLGLPAMAAMQMNRYDASCHLTWKFNERHVQRKLEIAGEMAA